MGISPIAAKIEQVSESIFGVSPRMQKNSNQMKEDLARYNKVINEAVDTQGQLAGDFLLELKP